MRSALVEYVAPVETSRLALQWHYLGTGLRLTECGPGLHELTALVELVTAPVGGLGFVADPVGQGMLAGLVRE